MKKLIGILILFIAVSTLVYSQFVLEQPIVEFDIDFTSDSLGILHYYGYRPTENEFWLDALTDSIFHNLIDPSETLILSSFAIIDDNTGLDDFVKTQ